jgi:hypothetical protein
MGNATDREWARLDRPDGCRDEPPKSDDAIRERLDELEGKEAALWKAKRKADLQGL